MRISTKGRYGTRLMLELALHYGEGSLSLKDIAKSQSISEKYLGHLVSPLKSAGLIKSIRGAEGGYYLTKAPAKITLKEVISALEGSLSAVECLDDSYICKRAESCVTRDIWYEMSAKIIETLDSITLQDMVARQKEKKSQEFLVYSI